MCTSHFSLRVCALVGAISTWFDLSSCWIRHDLFHTPRARVKRSWLKTVGALRAQGFVWHGRGGERREEADGEAGREMRGGEKGGGEEDDEGREEKEKRERR